MANFKGDVAGFINAVRQGMDKGRPYVDHVRSMIDSVDSGVLGTVLNKMPFVGTILAAVDLGVDCAASVYDVIDNYLDANGLPSAVQPAPIAKALAELPAQAQKDPAAVAKVAGIAKASMSLAQATRGAAAGVLPQAAVIEAKATLAAASK